MLFSARSMNFYEELGVARSASIAEIQQAYKALVRILHPDQQQDERLRRLSELQLTRLNQIAEALTDPGQRREYDLGLDGVPPLPTRPARIRWSPPRRSGILVWGLIGSILAVSLIFLAYEPPAKYSWPSKPESTAKVQQPPVEPATFRDPAPLAAFHKESPKPVPAPEEMGSRPVPGTQPGADPPTQAPEAAPVEEPTKSQEPAPMSPPRNAAASLRGRWLYANLRDDSRPGYYPPQYIEMQISYREGYLRGKYYAKYRVTDRALSSEVRFQFEGKANENAADLTWSGAEGSRGEVRLNPLSNDSLEVIWITTTFGRNDLLASGKAVLYRSDGP